MSLSQLYKQFLASPNASFLADDASLCYVPTLVTINNATAVIKHYTSQAKQLSKKAEKFVSVVEGSNALSIDVETTIEFQTGGGAYLPGLDDNFLTEKVVVLPSIHIVHFDEQQKIRQIRKYWDQGSLLKSIEVIGARARNWPLRDGKDQVRLISTYAAALTGGPGPSAPPTASRRTTASRDSDHRPLKSRSHAGSTTSATNDPHATLSLFGPRSVDEDERSFGPGPTPRASARPPTRDLEAILGGSEDPPAQSSPGASVRSPSPHKRMGIAPKSGAGKNFQPTRLFEEEEAPIEKGIKTNAKKYNHFEFGEGEEVHVNQAERDAKHKAKHGSQWGFEDFATPQAPKTRVRPNEERHFGWSDDEEKSPVRRPIVHRARPDAETHFEFVDDGTPGAERRIIGGAKGRTANNGQGLYKDQILGDDSDTPVKNAGAGAKKGPLTSITTNPNNVARTKDFGAHWDMTDESPEVTHTGENVGPTARKNVSEDRKKVIKGLDATWEMTDQSPEPTRQIYKTGGDGMGGKKGGRSWGIGDESEGEAENVRAGERKGRGGRGRAAAPGEQSTKDFWEF
ncbi:hypothetical protein P152DRAFT_457072 [Eremomyces bilateralis CBS 781.70]|uniref:NTF2-like protein n=1 Tax=Eremomyces bilateralis CBS 781.70 TaxID=1392243 RepID=A0A6G1G6Q1_9PEZI|nr:uncharacterized protein P152DRAFT_457072 [Eremomyces bilateralis CBS 781.70]KAF1813704.1 hypothetical protein P152DRAFT_457072 [Eremomyces bilateralis CBS 781.70]